MMQQIYIEFGLSKGDEMTKLKEILMNNDYDLADEITIANLLAAYDNILHNEANSRQHPEDVRYYEEIKDYLEAIIRYFSVDGDLLIQKVINNSKDKIISNKAKKLIATMGNR